MRAPLVVILAAALLAPMAALAPGAAAQSPSVSSDLGVANTYPYYPLLTQELKGLATEHKDILRLHSAGQSTTGLELWYVEVADFENPHRVPLDQREVLYIDGGTHANEYIGVIFVMEVLRSLVDGYGDNETATWVVENRHTIIMPLVNPEGSMNGVGRLNDNLVNINRNYPVGWYDVEETPVVNNPGPYPASEPETRGVLGVWERYDPDFVLSIHCCGNLWLYPYGIEGRHAHTDDRQVYERICDEVLYDVREDCGETWSTIYPASGITSDSAYELTGANSWSYEMKRTGLEEDPAAAYPWPWGPPAYTEDIKVLQKESWRAVMHAFLNVEKYGARPVAQVADVAGDALELRVENTGWGNLTQATVRVTDAGGVVRTVAVPALEAGAATTLAVPGDFAPGAHHLAIQYKKRPLDDSLGLVTHALTVVDTATGLVGAVGDVGLNSNDATVESGTAMVPGPAALAALAALCLGAALRRRW